VLTWENAMRGAIPMNAMAVMLGINCRVGNEDNIWRVKGERFPTVKQVEQMVKLAEAYGRKVATGKEAREIMQIGTWYDSVDETLFKLGWPPNRPDGKQGFVTWDTVGRHGIGAEASDSHPMAYCLVAPTSIDLDVPVSVDRADGGDGKTAEAVVMGTVDRRRLGGDRSRRRRLTSIRAHERRGSLWQRTEALALDSPNVGVNDRRRRTMARELSEMLSDMANQSKKIEDAFAAIAVETDAQAEQRREATRAAANAAVDRLDQSVSAASDTMAGHWRALTGRIDAEFKDLQTGSPSGSTRAI
jgi:hypothetical protein